MGAQGHYIPDLHEKYTERITALQKVNDFLLIGREDGVIECLSTDFIKNLQIDAIEDKQQNICHVKAFEPDFDSLENEDIKEKVTTMALTTNGGIYYTLFTGNEKNIKAFSIRENLPTIEICNNRKTGFIEQTERYRIKETQACKNVHSYVLNSMSLNNNKQYMLTADYIKINLWKPERLEKNLGLIDIKQSIAGGAIQVINTAKFSPFHDSIFSFSSSIGDLSVNDISLAPRSQRVMCFKNTYSQCIKSISDFVFVDSNFVLTRSMNNLCLFDQRNPRKEIYMVELVRSIEEQNKLNSGDAVYDKFRIDFKGHMAYTGSYNGSVYAYDLISNNVNEIPIEDVGGKCTKERKVKQIIAEDSGFVCSAYGKVLSYKLDGLIV